MRDTLPVEVERFLREIKCAPATANEIAIGVRARRDDVDEVLKSAPFTRVPPPDGCSPHAHYFSLSPFVPSPGKGKNRADLMLEVLKDGAVHSRQEIFERVGFMLTNNAASELRDRGLNVVHRVERRIHTYQLVAVSDEGEAA